MIEKGQLMVRLGGLGPGGLGFESGYPQVKNPFHKGIQSESEPPGPEPRMND